MREGLEEVGVQGEALFLHQFIGGVVHVVKEVKGCTQIGFDQDKLVRLLDKFQNAI